MSTETVRTLVLVAVPVLATGAWLVADIIAEQRDQRHVVESFAQSVTELRPGRAGFDTGNRDHGRA